MKFFSCLMILFTFFNSQAKTTKDIYTFSLNNGIEITLYENFNFPVVVTGVIYDFGTDDFPKNMNAVEDIVSDCFFNTKTKELFQANGISYTVNCHNEYTDIIAKMHPKDIKTFFRKISNLKFNTKDIDYKKGQLQLFYKIKNNQKTYAISDIISSEISRNSIFNEDEFNKLSKDDIDFLLEKYRRCNLKIIVCGAISHRGLLKVIKNTVSLMPSISPLKSRHENKLVSKTIFVHGEYRSNVLRYLFKSKENPAYWHAFLYLMKKFFMSEYPYVSGLSSRNCIAGINQTRIISIYPKQDIPIDKIQQLYQLFLNRISTANIEEESNKIQRIFQDNLKITRTNLFDMYEKLKYAILNQQNNINDCTISETEFKNITDFIKRNQIEIIERYRVGQ